MCIRDRRSACARWTSSDAKWRHFEACVEDLNAWNDRAQVIDTAEREALCAALDDIAHAAGFRGRDLAGPMRDW